MRVTAPQVEPGRDMRNPAISETVDATAEAMFDLVCYYAELDYNVCADKFGKDSAEAIAADQAWKNAGRLARLARGEVKRQIRAATR